MPLLHYNSEQEESDGCFRSSDAQNTDTLADDFPHDGFRVIGWRNICELLPNAISNADGNACYVTDKEGLRS